MRCPSCNFENKESAKSCKKCGLMLNIVPAWSPDWRWHAKSLGIIYLVLIAAYFLLNWFLRPYLRNIPPEVTPWLADAAQMHK